MGNENSTPQNSKEGSEKSNEATSIDEDELKLSTSTNPGAKVEAKEIKLEQPSSEEKEENTSPMEVEKETEIPLSKKVEEIPPVPKVEEKKEISPTAKVEETEKKMPIPNDIVEKETIKEEVKEATKSSAETMESFKNKLLQPAIMADIFMFIGTMALIAALASYLTPNDNRGKPPVKKMRSKSGKILIPVPEPDIDYSLNPNCGLVLSFSSIPGRGFGVFAIEKFDKDEKIYDFGVSLPTTKTGEHSSLESIFWELGDGEATKNIHLGTQLQSHPYFANVDFESSYLTAMKDINPGSELFLNRNLESEEETYAAADGIIKDMMGLLKRSPSQYGKQRENLNIQESALKIIKSTANRFDSDIAALLPTTMEHLGKVRYVGSAFQSIQNKTHAHLREHGKCMDKIKQGPSTEKNGGNGAFAKRDIKKGELIVPAVLFAIDKSKLETTTSNSEGVEYHSLVNYCFAHDESSVLLCHVSPAALINHKGANPNSEYQWSEWNLKNKYSRSSSPDVVYDKYGRNMMSFDIIATRDIKAGEEIFYDYGIKWQEAWTKYETEGDSSFTYSISIKDELIPNEWKN